jgi:cysteinyl-tRNA synthetase
MRVHYRAPLNFTWDGMEESGQALVRIDEWLTRLREVVAKEIDNGKNKTGPGEQFEEALDDDLNISAALGFLFESIRETNRAMDHNEMDAATANAWLKWWERVNSVLALGPGQETVSIIISVNGVKAKAALGSVQVIIEEALPPDIAKLAEERVQARLAKDFRKSDELRNELSARGWEVRDTKDGQKITRRAGS